MNFGFKECILHFKLILFRTQIVILRKKSNFLSLIILFTWFTNTFMRICTSSLFSHVFARHCCLYITYEAILNFFKYFYEGYFYENINVRRGRGVNEYTNFVINSVEGRLNFPDYKIYSNLMKKNI